jgi:hypothetical protein
MSNRRNYEFLRIEQRWAIGTRNEKTLRAQPPRGERENPKFFLDLSGKRREWEWTGCRWGHGNLLWAMGPS